MNKLFSAEKANITKTDAEKALNAFLETTKTEVASGGEIALVGFGTFKASKRAARTGRNPQTGEEIKIAATTVPKFSAGKGFKEAVANGAKGGKKKAKKK